MARMLRAGAWGVLCGLMLGGPLCGAAETLPGAAAATTAAAQTAPAAVEAPGDEARGKARTLIRNLFKEEYAKHTASERGALAKRLLREAGATKDDPAARYVALEEAADLAAGAGDAATAMASLEEMGKSFRVDTLDLKCKAMVRTQANAQTPEAGEALANACLVLMQQAAAADRFDAGRGWRVLPRPRRTRPRRWRS